MPSTKDWMAMLFPALLTGAGALVGKKTGDAGAGALMGAQGGAGFLEGYTKAQEKERTRRRKEGMDKKTRQQAIKLGMERMGERYDKNKDVQGLERLAKEAEKFEFDELAAYFTKRAEVVQKEVKETAAAKQKTETTKGIEAAWKYGPQAGTRAEMANIAATPEEMATWRRGIVEKEHAPLEQRPETFGRISGRDRMLAVDERAGRIGADAKRREAENEYLIADYKAKTANLGKPTKPEPEKPPTPKDTLAQYNVLVKSNLGMYKVLYQQADPVTNIFVDKTDAPEEGPEVWAHKKAIQDLETWGYPVPQGWKDRYKTPKVVPPPGLSGGGVSAPAFPQGPFGGQRPPPGIFSPTPDSLSIAQIPPSLPGATIAPTAALPDTTMPASIAGGVPAVAAPPAPLGQPALTLEQLTPVQRQKVLAAAQQYGVPVEKILGNPKVLRVLLQELGGGL